MWLSKIFAWLKCFFNQLWLRIKLLTKDKMSCLAFLLSICCFFLILRSFNLEAEEKSSIPIGFVNQDIDENGISSGFSKELIEGLKKVPSLYLYDGTFEQMEALFHKGQINCYFVIEKGYHNDIRRGKRTELLTVYQTADNKIASVIADIIAGEMMYQICLSRSFYLYNRLELEKKVNREHFESYAESLKGSPEFEFQFHITYLDTSNHTIEGKQIKNSLLYRQVLVGITAILVSFVMFFFFSFLPIEKEHGITKRRKIAPDGKMAVILGNFTAIVLCFLLLCFIFCGSIQLYAVPSASFSKLAIIFMIYVVIIGFLFLYIGTISKTLFRYQMAGAAIVSVFGILGFFSIIEGIWIPELGILFKLIPNSWFIEQFTAIIV